MTPGPARQRQAHHRPASGAPRPQQGPHAKQHHAPEHPGLRDVDRQRLALAIVMLVVAIVLGIIALFMFHADYHRWQAARTLHRMGRYRFENPTVIPAEAQALSHMSNPAAALSAIDPSAPGAAERYRSLAARATVNDRRLAMTGARLAAILAGQDDPQQIIAEPDRLLLDHLAQLMAHREGPPPALPSISADRRNAPQMAVLKSCFEAQVSAAWKAGDIASAREAARHLITLNPRHRCAPRLQLIEALFDPDPSRQTQRVRRAVGSLSQDKQSAMIRDMFRLMHHDHTFSSQYDDITTRAYALGAELIPPRHRSPGEAALSLVSASNPRALYQAASSSDDARLITIAAMRAAEEGHWGEIDKFLPRVLPSHRPGLALKAAINRIDPDALTTLVADAETRAALTPQPRAMRLHNNRLTFHLINGTDTIDPAGIAVMINNRQIQETQIDRFGSLFSVQVPGEARAIRVRLTLNNRDIIDEVEVGQ